MLKSGTISSPAKQKWFIVVLRRLVNATPSATWTPSECYNRPTFCRLLTAYRRKSNVADPAGYLRAYAKREREKLRQYATRKRRMKTGEGEESPSVASSSARERGKREGERERGKERERERKKKRAFQFGHKRPLTNVVFFFLLKGEKAPPFRWISDLPAMTTVPESPSLLLRFLDRATGFRRKRPPPFRG